jgi:Oxidoreductase-like protein, N-terminal
MEALIRLSLASRTSWTCPNCRRAAAHLGRAQWSHLTRDVAKRDSQHRQKRNFHSSVSRAQQLKQSAQAHPLGDFYSDLLSQPIPKTSKATSSSSLPTFVRSGDQTKEERAKKLFGNLRGSGYERTVSEKPDTTWRTLNGVPVPPRPGEPDNCCMSGCAHCVWDDYRDDVEQWAHRLREAQAKGAAPSETRTTKAHSTRPELASASSSMDDDGGGSEALWTAPSPGAEEDALFSEIPVGIREFMATEKRIRDRKKTRKQKNR